MQVKGVPPICHSRSSFHHWHHTTFLTSVWRVVWGGTRVKVRMDGQLVQDWERVKFRREG